MILEAFSAVLKQTPMENRTSEDVLDQWLMEILMTPPKPGDHVSRVIHTEIGLIVWNNQVRFEGRSESGDRLLKALRHYCKSYETWQFSRWLHQTKASDFRTA